MFFDHFLHIFIYDFFRYELIKKNKFHGFTGQVSFLKNNYLFGLLKSHSNYYFCHLQLLTLSFPAGSQIRSLHVTMFGIAAQEQADSLRLETRECFVEKSESKQHQSY